MKPLRLIALLVLVWCCANRTQAQDWISNDNRNDELAKYEVKTIDEFFERFDDDPHSFLRDQAFREHKPYNISKSQLLASLFNHENTKWRDDTALDLRGFFDAVLDTAHPFQLAYADTDWYAEAACVFLLKGKKVEIPVFLHIVKENKGIKWMVAGIGDNKILKDTGNVKLPDNSKIVPNPKFIPSSSNSVNFVDFVNIMVPTINAPYFFEPYTLASTRVKQFVQMITQNKLKFQYVRAVRYRFFQMPGRVFDVEHFERASYNSGWLINDLKKMTQEDKNRLRLQILHLD
jgi:hypothetical protein